MCPSNGHGNMTIIVITSLTRPMQLYHWVRHGSLVLWSNKVRICKVYSFVNCKRKFVTLTIVEALLWVVYGSGWWCGRTLFVFKLIFKVNMDVLMMAISQAGTPAFGVWRRGARELSFLFNCLDDFIWG